MLTACGKSNEKASLEKSINQLEKENKDLKKQKKDLQTQKDKLKDKQDRLQKDIDELPAEDTSKNHLKRANQILVRKMVQTRHLLTIQNNQQKHRSQINLKHHLRTLSSPVNRIKMLIKTQDKASTNKNKDSKSTSNS